MRLSLLRRKFLRIGLFCVLSLSLISWDKVSKNLAKAHLRDQPMRSYMDDTFRLLYVENTGAAMSFADGLNPKASFWLLGVLPLAVLAGVLVYVIVHAREMRVARMVAFSLIFAGGMGNILDRLFFDRHVTDFMNIGVQDFRSGVFNFADLWITTGVICLLFWRGGGRAGTGEGVVGMGGGEVGTDDRMDSTGKYA
jgi:signal peptidase II